MAITTQVTDQHLFRELTDHKNHKVVLEPYQEKNKIWLECLDCYEVLAEFVNGVEEIEDAQEERP